MSDTSARGEEFRDDLRPLPSVPGAPGRPGAGNAAGRRVLSPDELALGGWQALAQYVVLWLLPLLTVLQPILRLHAIAEHGAVTDLSSPLTAARCNRTAGSPGNILARALLFPHHVNYHLEHHVYPAVPHCHLPALHERLQRKGVLAGAEVRDVAATMRIIFAPRASGPAADPAGGDATR